jgi:hypothetical protein
MIIEPDGLYYHYCDLAALNGIIEHKSLWMTNLFYLNDSLEHFWLRNKAIDLLYNKADETEHELRQVIDLNARLNLEFSRDFYLTLLSTIQTSTLEDIFCTSFSVLPDSLSQWRAYADDGCGFAVGFDGDELRKLHSDLKDVNYDEQYHTRLIDTYLAEAIMAGKAAHAVVSNTSITEPQAIRDSNRAMLEDVKGQFRRKVWDEAIYCKNPAFKEEQEWRLVHKAHIERDASTGDVQTSTARQLYKFRPRGKQLIPYVEFKFMSSPSSPPGPIRHVVFGPKNTSTEQERVLRDRLSQEDFMAVQFSHSGASYR